MDSAPHTAALALASLLSSYTGCRIAADDMQIIATGASGRSVMRAGHPATVGLLGIYWTNDRADNASFVPAAKGLAKAGIRVPALLAVESYGNGCGACLVQDLGKEDLLSLKGQAWKIRRAAYVKTLEIMVSLHKTKPDWELQPPFDANLYCWEQQYFAEHLLARHCGWNAVAFLAQPPLHAMADWLAALPRTPMHRDCQSQNVMLYDGEAWLIDFQGMRQGRAEYDLASLLYDPYMGLAPAERNELELEYERICGHSLDREIYSACALQRIMQALGAFANIGYNQHRSFYLNLIPAGLEALRQIARSAPADSHAALAASCLPNVK